MKKWLAWGIPALILIVLVAWRFKANAATETHAGGAGGGKGRQMSTVVEVVPATSRTIVENIQTVGNVVSPYKVEISPKTAGRIEKLDLREGDPVQAGQVVLTIDPSDLAGAVVQAEADVATAKSRLAQAELTQGATNTGVSSQIKQQKASVESAKADLNQVQSSYSASVAAAQAQVDAAQAGVNNAIASLAKEQANLENAQTKYSRTYSLYQKGYVAAQDVDDAKTAVEVEKGAVGVQQAQVNSAKSQLNSQQQNLEIVKRKGRSDIADSQAKLTQAKATLEVANANRSQSPAYQQNIDALRSGVSAAEAALSQAQARMADTKVRSSITGTVTARKADPGALASPGSPVLEVQFLDWLYVTAPVPVENSAQVHEGQTAQITFDALPGRVFTGKIVNLNLAADPQSRQFTVSIRLDNRDHMLRPGMYAKVTIEIGRVQAAVTVPREALTTAPDGTTTVTVVDSGNVAHVRQVKLGASDDKGSEVLSGVDPGDKVVVLTYSPIKDGSKVSIGSLSSSSRKGKSGGQGRGRQGGGGGRTQQ